MNGRLLRVLVPAILFLALPLLLSQDAGAASFTAQNASSLTINASATNYPITISITNTDSSLNITRVNLTLYGFSYIAGTNSTTESNANFNSSSSIALGWINGTTPLIASGGGVQNFTFNVNVSLTTGSYNITVNVTDTSSVYNSTNITYSVVDNPSYLLTFNNLSNMGLSTNLIQNLSYLINITNTGSLRKTYNLSVVNCSNTGQAGVGILNYSLITLNASENKTIQLNVSNSTAGLYSSCIMAKHYNGTTDSSNVTSVQNGVILNSGFYPDLVVPIVYWTSTGGQNPFAGGNITVNATLNNTGHFNFLGNVSVYLLWDGVPVNNTVTVANTSLLNGTPYNVNFSSITVSTNGLHNLSVFIDAGSSVTELNESNNINTTQVFVGYNVTILNVTGYSNITQTGLNATPSSNVTLNVSVKYANGNGVSGLTNVNFTVSDIYNGGTTISGFLNFTGYYIFNITAYSNPTGDTEPGIHNLTISASNNESGNSYSGASNGADYYNLLVPKLVVTVYPEYTSYERDMLTGQWIYINITNVGSDNMYNTTMTYSDPYGILVFSGTLSCSPSNPPANVSASSSYMCHITNVYGKDISGQGDQPASVSVTVRGNYPYNGTAYIAIGDSNTINIVDTTASSTGGTGGGGSTARRCTSDVSCLTNETCSSSKTCVSISCPNGQIVNRTCVGSAAGDRIGITSFGAALESISGGTASTKVTVKNTGTTAYVAKLGVTISGITADVTPTGYSLGAGESYQFTVNFTVPNTTAVGNFSGTFKAYVSSNTSAYESKSFTFSVLPTEQTKSEINVSYGELSSVLSSLIANLSQMKASGRYNQSVISSIEELINSANSTLSQIKSAIDSDDYISANSLISQVNTSISTAEAQIQTAQLEVLTSLPAQYGIWFWVAVGVIIIFVVGFFVYMFYPSSHVGYHPEKGYAHPEAKEGLGTKIKKLFKRKKKEPAPPSISTNMTAQSTEEPKEVGHYDTFHYSEGYKKEKSYDYQYSGGKGLFGRFRKGKEKTPQMHLDQFAGQPDTEEKKSE